MWRLPGGCSHFWGGCSGVFRFGGHLSSWHGAALEEAKEGEMRAAVMQRLGMLYLCHFRLYDAVIALQSGLAGTRNPTTKQRFIKKILFACI